MTGLRDALIGLDHRSSSVCAVMDGAQFDHLPNLLAGAGFEARPLYLGRTDPNTIVTAPHLVALSGRRDRTYGDALDAILAMVGDRPAAVFWHCTEGTEALYRHLRSINQVMVPREQLSEEDVEEGSADDETHMMVLFRHADANVLAQMLGRMTTGEFVRFIGPASAVHFAPDADWGTGDGSMRAQRLEGEPPPRPGPLRLSRETMARMSDLRLQRSHRRIVDYLRKTAPAHTGHLDDRQIAVATATYMKEAQGHGVVSEAALGRWCYLQAITNGEMGRQKGVVDFVTKRNLGNNPGASSDERVEVLMWMAKEQTRRLGR